MKKLINKQVAIAAILAILVFQGSSSAEIRKMSDSELKSTRAQTGITEVLDKASDAIFLSQTPDAYNGIKDIADSLDILVSDKKGKWEIYGNTSHENGIINLDETIYTSGITYENIRIKGTNAGSFGSISIGEAKFEIKGQLKVTFRP